MAILKLGSRGITLNVIINTASQRVALGPESELLDEDTFISATADNFV